jgi:hypothetical protein
MSDRIENTRRSNRQLMRRWRWFGFHIEWQHDLTKPWWWQGYYRANLDTYGYRRYWVTRLWLGRVFVSFTFGDPHRPGKAA